jgi:hypothetical protein
MIEHWGKSQNVWRTRYPPQRAYLGGGAGRCFGRCYHRAPNWPPGNRRKTGGASTGNSERTLGGPAANSNGRYGHSSAGNGKLAGHRGLRRLGITSGKILSNIRCLGIKIMGFGRKGWHLGKASGGNGIGKGEFEYGAVSKLRLASGLRRKLLGSDSG